MTSKYNLPILPLLEYVLVHGGIFEAIDARRRDLTPEECDVIKDRTWQRVSRALDRGDGIDPYDADEIATEGLRVHPVEIWGQLWFETPMKTCDFCEEIIENDSTRNPKRFCSTQCRRRNDHQVRVARRRAAELVPA